MSDTCKVVVNTMMSNPSLEAECDNIQDYEVIQMIDGIVCKTVAGGQRVIQTISKSDEPLKRLIGDRDASITKMLLNAVNNRTRERNYFRLYSELLENSITEDFFSSELEKNEKNYVISESETPTKENVRIALKLTENLMDVNDSEDLASLFSFRSSELEKIIKEIEKK